MGGPLLALLFGSVPLGTYFGIRVRAHACLIILIATTLLLDYGASYPLEDRLVSMGMLVVLVLLHEFGHCFAARWTGGEASEIMMWPLGGLATVDPPRRPGAVFFTAAAGPLVNLTLCVLLAIGLHFGPHLSAPWNPFSPLPPESLTWHSTTFYAWWAFVVSYYLLLFNLLPMYPMDGGQMLQAMLWTKLGHYHAINATCIIGMASAVVLAGAALPSLNWFMLAVAVWAFLACYQQRTALKSMSPDDVRESIDYPGILDEPDSHRRRRLSKRSIRRARRLIRREEADQAKLDAVLAKVSARGMASLTWLERRALRKATEHQRQRDLELTRNPRE